MEIRYHWDARSEIMEINIRYIYSQLASLGKKGYIMRPPNVLLDIQKEEEKDEEK